MANEVQGFFDTESHQKIEKRVMILEDVCYRPNPNELRERRKKSLNLYRKVFLDRSLREEQVRKEIEKSFAIKEFKYNFAAANDKNGKLHFHNNEEWSTENIKQWAKGNSVLYVVVKFNEFKNFINDRAEALSADLTPYEAKNKSLPEETGDLGEDSYPHEPFSPDLRMLQPCETNDNNLPQETGPYEANDKNLPEETGPYEAKDKNLLEETGSPSENEEQDYGCIQESQENMPNDRRSGNMKG